MPVDDQIEGSQPDAANPVQPVVPLADEAAAEVQALPEIPQTGRVQDGGNAPGAPGAAGQRQPRDGTVNQGRDQQGQALQQAEEQQAGADATQPANDQDKPKPPQTQQSQRQVTEVPGPATFRGPLRYELETSTNTLVAGAMFSLFVRITNPYNVEVTVNDVHTEVAVEFWLHPDPAKRPRFRDRFIYTEPRTTLLSAQAVARPKLKLAPGEVAPHPGTPSPPPEPIVLQPGNSVLHEFALKTSKWLFFSPSMYYMHVQVSYTMEGKLNHDTVKTALNVKAPIVSMVLGSIPGAIIGTFIRRTAGDTSADGKPAPQVRLGIAEYFLGVVVAMVTVVMLARKKDAQPFLSVEDVYGGVFVGIVAGYTGPAILKPLLSAPQVQAPTGGDKGGMLNVPDILALAPRSGSELVAMASACVPRFLRHR